MECLKIVLFAANPFGDLKLDEEMRRIKHKLDRRNLERIEIISVEATRPGDLIDELNEHKPQIVQFSGHGVRGSRSPEGTSPGSRDFETATDQPGSGMVILVGEDGTPKPVSEKGLVGLFHQRRNIVRVVVLNACYTGTQAKAIAEYVDCVIGTDRSIKDEAARIFVARFYRSLAESNPVATAFEEAKNELELEGFEDQATIPQMFAREGIDLTGLWPLPRKPVANTSESAEDEPDIIMLGIKRLVECTDIPMYFADAGLCVLFSNKPFATLLDLSVAGITGQHISAIIEKLVNIAPVERRMALRKKQLLLLDKVAHDLTDHCEENEILDHRNMAGNRYQGLNRVWISCDKVYTKKQNKLIGVFVVYHVDPIKDPEIWKKYPEVEG